MSSQKRKLTDLGLEVSRPRKRQRKSYEIFNKFRDYNVNCGNPLPKDNDSFVYCSTNKC